MTSTLFHRGMSRQWFEVLRHQIKLDNQRNIKDSCYSGKIVPRAAGILFAYRELVVKMDTSVRDPNVVMAYAFVWGYNEDAGL